MRDSQRRFLILLRKNALPCVGRFRYWRLAAVATLAFFLVATGFIVARAQPPSTTPEATTPPTVSATPAAGGLQTEGTTETAEEASASNEADAGNEASNGITADATATPSTSAGGTPARDGTPTTTPEATATPDGPPAATATPEAQPGEPRPYARTFVLVLGGVTWDQWATLGSAPPAALPGFRRLLEESGLAAVRAPGAEASLAPETSEGSIRSTALLRVASILSSGATQTTLDSKNLESAAYTWNFNERVPAALPPQESSAVGLAYARRAGGQAPTGALLNPGVPALSPSIPTVGDTLNAGEAARSGPGSLGELAHAAGQRTAAFGSADTGLLPGQGAYGREWALVASDGRGVIDTGDVSRALLARDADVPYGVRVNGRALLNQLRDVLAGTNDPVTFVAMEWGDTRRAARYAPFCSPAQARKHRTRALQRADAFLLQLLQLLADSKDRLYVVAVPDLDGAAPQWLPLAVWRPQKGGQGALLQAQARGEQPGVTRLEDLALSLANRVGAGDGTAVAAGANASGQASTLREVGAPSSASRRLSRLMALQAGVSRLDAARPVADGIIAGLMVGGCVLALLLLLSARRPLITPYGPGNIAQAGGRRLARGVWRAAMVYPLLLWVAGLSVEATWRAGHFAILGQPGRGNNSLPLPFFLLAVCVLILLGFVWSWFRRGKVRGVRVGMLWLGMTVAGLWIGGFALPWNSLTGASLSHDTTARTGDFWALLLISATMLGVASLTRPAQAKPLSEEPLPPEDTTPFDRYVVGEPEDETAQPSERRVLNLRPAAIWMVLTTVVLAASGWGNNGAAATVAVVGFGAMWLRLWLEKYGRGDRLRQRRWVLGAVVAFALLLLAQRGGMRAVEASVIAWWPVWLASWDSTIWNLAFGAVLAGVALFLTGARPLLRAYLSTRYSSRAMLAGAALAGLVALLVYGPPGPPLIALYTYGALLHDVLGRGMRAAPRAHAESEA